MRDREIDADGRTDVYYVGSEGRKRERERNTETYEETEYKTIKTETSSQRQKHEPVYMNKYMDKDVISYLSIGCAPSSAAIAYRAVGV